MRVDEEVSEVQDATRPDFAKYGSKIAAIVEHVQRLQTREPGCKIICFVQWEDLKRKISSALDEFKVAHLTLHGSVWARRSALTRFQYEVDCPRMLLLSLQESASGTNLTSANHVIIVHPMEAATPEEAVAFEMQAIGRVRRPGQTKKIHIWRFVTVGTIEQQITEEHQRELWERQSAKILLPDAELQLGESEDELVEDAPIALDASTQCYGGSLPPQAGATVANVQDVLDGSTQAYAGAMDVDALDTLPWDAQGAAGPSAMICS